MTRLIPFRYFRETYDPNEPRVPKGSEKGGEWTKESDSWEKKLSQWKVSDKTTITIGRRQVPIKPSPDSVYQVADACFMRSKLLGPRIASTKDLSGGVRGDDYGERMRVSELKDEIMGEDGYISRIIIDQYGNTMEGQHRLEALRELKASRVPVFVVLDLDNEKENPDEAIKKIDSIIASNKNKQMEKDKKTAKHIEEIGERLAKMLNCKVTSLGSGAAEVGLRRGVITPQEGNLYAKAKGWRFVHLNTK